MVIICSRKKDLIDLKRFVRFLPDRALIFIIFLFNFFRILSRRRPPNTILGLSKDYMFLSLDKLLLVTKKSPLQLSRATAEQAYV